MQDQHEFKGDPKETGLFEHGYLEPTYRKAGGESSATWIGQGGSLLFLGDMLVSFSLPVLQTWYLSEYSLGQDEVIPGEPCISRCSRSQ